MKMDEKTSDLLAGRLTSQDIPSVPLRVVRIFFCSTGTGSSMCAPPNVAKSFSYDLEDSSCLRKTLCVAKTEGSCPVYWPSDYDSCTERTAFMEHVYPKLREYCRHRYGLEFQVIDLSWGLAVDQQTLDKSFADFSMQEILKCQQTSTGPNFVAFIGQKYGARPLPTSILAEQYEVIRVALHAHRGRDTRNAPLLDQCYVIDTNSVPPVYVLRPVRHILHDLGQAKGEAVQETEEQQQKVETGQETEERWRELQTELVTLLQKGAELAYLDGVLDSDVRSSFFMSDLEKEIQMGIENCDNPHNRCVLILRDIVDLKNNLEDTQASAFTELTFNPHRQSHEVDEDAENRIVRLKNRARGLISVNNSMHHEVLWKFDQVIHPTLHHHYLQTLCGQLYDAVQRLVDMAASDLPENDLLPPVVTESLRHWSHCKNLSADFLDCQPQLQQLRDYVTGYSGRPLVLHGASGCGKTKLVSKLALELSELVPGPLLSLIRFVGLTASSSDVRQLLLGMCRQLTVALGYLPDSLPTDFKGLQRFFPQLLQSVPVHTNVVIILDALDQLLPDHNVHLMTWLPIHLPAHVKILVTTQPERHGVLKRLQEEVLGDCPSSFLQLQPLGLPQCQLLLQHFLTVANRQITEDQMATFCERFQTCSLPLYVKLMAEEARTLTSFTDTSSLQLAADCTDSIHSLLHRLEEKHGRAVVSRSMAYLVASVTGLSDVEMEDLLSLDDLVLNYLFTKHHPPLRRVPCAVWLKIRRDLENFLTIREADGVTVTMWEHDSFVQAARQRYLREPEDVSAVHSLLADYFLGTWAGKGKPVQLAEGSSQFPACGAQANRMVPSQPLTFPAYGNHSTVSCCVLHIASLSQSFLSSLF